VVVDVVADAAGQGGIHAGCGGEHPGERVDLIAALTDDRRRFSRCGAVSGHPFCAVSLSQSQRPSVRWLTGNADQDARRRYWIFTVYSPVLRMIGKGADC
jgi:hypothetical protein